MGEVVAAPVPGEAPPPPPVAPASTPTAGTPSSRSAANHSSQKLSPSDANDGIPTEEMVNEKTLEDEPPNLAIPGEFTEQLSEVSEAEDEQAKATASRNAVSTWYRHIQPLVRNKRVRVFSVINLIMSILNLILFIGALTILGFLILEAVEINQKLQQDKPCVFQWTEWSSCSATCASDGTSPTKERHINKSSIIEARGDKYKACPSDLETKKDYAPCNTHGCPIKLSSVTEYTECFYKDITKLDKCYKMRNLTIGDYLVEIDVPDITEECDCPSRPVTLKP